MDKAIHPKGVLGHVIMHTARTMTSDTHQRTAAWVPKGGHISGTNKWRRGSCGWAQDTASEDSSRMGLAPG